MCGANPGCAIQEKTFLHGPADVAMTAPDDIDNRDQVGLVIDVEGHNTLRVHEQDCGQLLFQVDGLGLLGYTVCHFGGKWSAYWWACFGGLAASVVPCPPFVLARGTPLC